MSRSTRGKSIVSYNPYGLRLPGIRRVAMAVRCGNVQRHFGTLRRWIEIGIEHDEISSMHQRAVTVAENNP